MKSTEELANKLDQINESFSQKHSDLLEIKKEGKLAFLGEYVDTSKVDLRDFLMSSIGLNTTINEEPLLGDIVHLFYYLNDFIKNYFDEEYETLRAFINSSNLSEEFSHATIFKEIEITSDNYIYTTPKIAFNRKEGYPFYKKLSDIVVEIDNNIVLPNELNINELKSPFSLLDILSALFEELMPTLKDGRSISP